jgi:hypothetical protein
MKDSDLWVATSLALEPSIPTQASWLCVLPSQAGCLSYPTLSLSAHGQETFQ